MSIDDVLTVSDGELFTTQIFPLKISSPQMPDERTMCSGIPLIDLLEVFEGCFHISAKYPPIKTLVNSAAQQTELINRSFGCNLSLATLRSWKYVENPSLPNLIRFFQVHGIDIDKTWKEVSLKSRGSPWIKLARYIPFDENFAYVVGALLADRGHKQEISIVDMDLGILKEFVERLCTCFPLKKSDFFVYVHALEQPPSEFLSHISTVLEIPAHRIKVIQKPPSKRSPTIYFRVGVRNAIIRAIFDHGIAFINQLKERAPAEVKGALLAGLLNGEGCISKISNSWVVRFECYNPQILELAKSLVQEFGIKTYMWSPTTFCFTLKSRRMVDFLLTIVPITGEKKTKVLLARHDIRASLCMDDITREFTGRTFTVEDVAREFQISRKRAKQFTTRLQNKNYIFFREKGYVVRSDENELDRQVS